MFFASDQVFKGEVHPEEKFVVKIEPTSNCVGIIYVPKIKGEVHPEEKFVVKIAGKIIKNIGEGLRKIR